MLPKIKFFLISTLLFIFIQGCEAPETNLPVVSVNIQVDPATLAQIGIGTASYCPIEGGVKGIIIYRDIDKYNAYDRICTNYPNDNIGINIDENKVTGTCPSCGSQFSLYDGSIIKGPAKYPLYQYQTSLMGNRLYISNY